MAGDPAELAYGHALAMLGDPAAAAEIAITACAAAGRTRRLVLAHACHQAVARAELDEPVEIESLQLMVLDLPALAATLASTRPPEDAPRSMYELVPPTWPTSAKRSACDRATRRTGRPPSRSAGGRARSGVARVQRGRRLRGVGGDSRSGRARDGCRSPRARSAVGSHVWNCMACSDRTRAMNSVRSFFSARRGRGPSRRARREPPQSTPATIGSRGSPVRRLERHARLRVTTPRIVAAAIVAVLAVGGVAFAVTRDDGTNDLADLTKVARTAGHVITPATAGDVSTIELRNTTDLGRRRIADRIRRLGPRRTGTGTLGHTQPKCCASLHSTARRRATIVSR